MDGIKQNDHLKIIQSDYLKIIRYIGDQTQLQDWGPKCHGAQLYKQKIYLIPEEIIAS